MSDELNTPAPSAGAPSGPLEPEPFTFRELPLNKEFAGRDSEFLAIGDFTRLTALGNTRDEASDNLVALKRRLRAAAPVAGLSEAAYEIVKMLEFGSFQRIGGREGKMCGTCYRFAREGHTVECSVGRRIAVLEADQARRREEGRASTGEAAPR